MSQCRTCIVFPGTNIALFCRAWCPLRVPWRLPDTNLVQFSCSLFQVSGGALGIPYDPLGLWESLGGSTDQQMLCFRGPWASLMVPWGPWGHQMRYFPSFRGVPWGPLYKPCSVQLFKTLQGPSLVPPKGPLEAPRYKPCSVQLFPFPGFRRVPGGPLWSLGGSLGGPWRVPGRSLEGPWGVPGKSLGAPWGVPWEVRGGTWVSTEKH